MFHAEMCKIKSSENENRLKGLLLGVAVGDSLGLPAEGLSRRRAEKFFHGKWEQRFLFGCGMISDDTEHTVFVAECLLQHPNSVSEFRRLLAWKFRIWFLGLPAGIGYATLRSILKLWLGVSPEKSGVYSAGNGPAMRAAIIGAYFAHSPECIDDYIQASTLLTHTDPKALIGASAIAHLAAWAFKNQPASSLNSCEVFSILEKCNRTNDSEWQEIINKMRSAFEQGFSVAEFALQMNLSKGVSGYIYHTVPVSVYSWIKHFGEFEQTLLAVLNCGGDTDTVASIAGALAGATSGDKAIRKEWLEKIHDYPCSIHLLKTLAGCLTTRQQGLDSEPVKTPFFPFVLARNMLFLVVVLLHGLRRLAPPY
jgi:ADP-ribosyl-[dinitrogen reductase] hydrolase